MKLNELRNGDMVITRYGYVAMFQGEIVLYEEGGYDYWEDNYEEDLTSWDSDMDIMLVYRKDGGGLEFEDFEDDCYAGECIFSRDVDWVRPTKEEMDRKIEEEKARMEAQEAERKTKLAERKERMIAIMTQAFYGNRTGTRIDVEDMDRFILGYLDRNITIREKIDRSIIKIPNTNNLVMVYNRYAEEKSRNDSARFLKEEGRELKPLAVIPEENIKLCSRCIVCRMNENGEFKSLEKGDIEKFIKYLAE